MITTPGRQSGFTLITAIFVLVVLAALGSYMVSISGTQHFTTLHALQSAKAYHAARSGIEWGIARLSSTSCADANGHSLDLDGFSVTIQCSGSDEHGIYRLVATAQAGSLGSPDHAARQLDATITVSP